MFKLTILFQFDNDWKNIIVLQMKINKLINIEKQNIVSFQLLTTEIFFQTFIQCYISILLFSKCLSKWL